MFYRLNPKHVQPGDEKFEGSVVGSLVRDGLLDEFTLERVGGTYEHPWDCSNCHTDHGGEGCDRPDFGAWNEWYRINDGEETP